MPDAAYQYAQFRFANESPSSYRPPPPDLQHIYNMKRRQQEAQQHQFTIMYNPQYDTPPVLPAKPKKKSSLLKSPFNAIKRAFSRTKPLKRQNSMKETVDNPIQIPPGRGLRRQHSMIEPSRTMAFTPDMSLGRRNNRGFVPNPEYLSYHEPFTPNDHRSTTAGDYTNLETEAIYGNCGGVQHLYDNREASLYANRIEIEGPNEYQGEGPREARIRRRHSMADRQGQSSRGQRSITNGRYDVPPPPEPVSQREEIYQTRSGAFMLDSVIDRRPLVSTGDETIYQSRKEMHRDHLYQSRDEMHKRIQQGRDDENIRNSQASFNRCRMDEPLEEGRVSSSNSSSTTKDQLVYQSRKELKERGFKTRTQLRDHIYQSRLEAMQSMAEPLYVSKNELQQNSKVLTEPTIECPIAVAEEVSYEEDKDLVESNHDLSLKAVIDHLDNGFIGDETNDSTLADNSQDGPNEIKEVMGDDEEVTLTNPNQSDIEKSAAAAVSDQIVPAAIPPPMTPRSIRAPYHISNIIKRTAPPPSPTTATASPSGHQYLPCHPHASQTSIETQFTSATVSSLISLPTGPPNAQSTPYTSEMTLPASFFPPLREQTTTSGVFDEHGGTLSDDVWNVSIHIPAGSIPAGRQQEIYFTVTDPRLSQTVGGPPLDMENGWSQSKHIISNCVFSF